MNAKTGLSPILLLRKEDISTGEVLVLARIFNFGQEFALTLLDIQLDHFLRNHYDQVSGKTTLNGFR